VTDVLSPCAGTVLPLSDVPDPVFSAEMVGPGVAIDPVREATTVVAPIAGKVLKALPHACVLVGDDGTGVLVHLGIDTNRLEGEGFDVLVEEGTSVAAGDPLVRWNPADVEAGGRSPVIPVCIMDGPKGAVTSPLAGGETAVGDVLFTWRT
jgi:sugar PTS system EIIA component